MHSTPEHSMAIEDPVIRILKVRYEFEDGNMIIDKSLVPGKYILNASVTKPEDLDSINDIYQDTKFTLLHLTFLSTGYDLEPHLTTQTEKVPTAENINVEMEFKVEPHLLYGELKLPVIQCTSNLLVYNKEHLLRLFSQTFDVK